MIKILWNLEINWASNRTYYLGDIIANQRDRVIVPIRLLNIVDIAMVGVHRNEDALMKEDFHLMVYFPIFMEWARVRYVGFKKEIGFADITSLINLIELL
ncbi:MAG: hypothetical protein Ta2E_10020 [Mycoplasmoidaceae bacterium]|nr:MAG: hypothetical protein Ta2E_10020 [Mycoplasmoidaceae bacterium]